MGHPHACTDPHHHVDDADAFVAAVERACGERGLRLTPQRARVLALIAQAGVSGTFAKYQRVPARVGLTGAMLARRGAHVDAVLLAPDKAHPAGLAALRGGRA